MVDYLAIFNGRNHSNRAWFPLACPRSCPYRPDRSYEAKYPNPKTYLAACDYRDDISRPRYRDISLGLLKGRKERVGFSYRGLSILAVNVDSGYPAYGDIVRTFALLIWWLRPHARLAMRTLTANKRQSANTAAALMIGVALVAVGATLAASTKASTDLP